MRPITTAQLSKLHVLLNQFGIIEDKADLVNQFTNGRETSSKRMTFHEARILLQHLSRFDPLDKMRKKVFALAYVARIIYGDTPDDKKMNAAKLDKFLREKGAIKKHLNTMNKDELIKVVNQFSQIVKHNAYNTISKNTKIMLSEIGIVTSKRGAVNPL
ncbi:MAG: hypothetical protein ABIU77_17055 [Ferruginibacter sp.]